MNFLIFFYLFDPKFTEKNIAFVKPTACVICFNILDIVNNYIRISPVYFHVMNVLIENFNTVRA